MTPIGEFFVCVYSLINFLSGTEVFFNWLSLQWLEVVLTCARAKSGLNGFLSGVMYMDWGAYGLYVLELITGAVLFVGVIMVIASVASGAQHAQQDKGRVMVADLSEEWDDLEKSMNEAMLSKVQLKQFKKDEKERQKEKDKEEAKREKAKAKGRERPSDDVAAQSEESESGGDTADADSPRVFVLDFDGDVYANECEELRECITAILMVANPSDEVVVRLESPGGVVHGYGLASSQLARIRTHGLHLTACVDKVAASGGYMMACVANQVVAAPFAILGSVGVIAQLPNFHRLLKRVDVDFEEHTAGEYKRTLTVFGENTDEKREKFKEELDDIHGLFRSHVTHFRPQLNMEEVATGETWHGTHALDKQLIDSISTSDEYLMSKREGFKVLHVYYERPKSLKERLGINARALVESCVSTLYRAGRGWV